MLHVFNHPSELDLPISKVLERIQAIGQQFPLDAVEITSKGFRTPEFDIPEIPYVKIATDDFPYPDGLRQSLGRDGLLSGQGFDHPDDSLWGFLELLFIENMDFHSIPFGFS